MERRRRPWGSRTLLRLPVVVAVLVLVVVVVKARAAPRPRCPAGFLRPLSSTPQTWEGPRGRRRARVPVMLAAGAPHQQPRHSQAASKRRRAAGSGSTTNPLKALQQAVGMTNGLLRLLYSAGDMFGQVSSSSTTPAADFGIRRRGGGGGSQDGQRSPSPPAAAAASAAAATGRWRGPNRRSDGGDDEEGERAQLDDREFAVSKQDLNTWDTWYGGGRPQRQGSGGGADPNEQQQQQRGQRRRKKVTFSTRYSCAVSVANATRLAHYMTLPFDQYSLLDQTFISRVEGQGAGVFRFTVPANELVGLQTVPIVDVKVAVDPSKRVLSIASIASRLVSRAADGTVLSTHQVGLLADNSLKFSTHISWAEPGGQGAILGGLGRGNGTTESAAGGVDGAGGRQRKGPGANLAQLRRRIFQGAPPQQQQQQQEIAAGGAVGDETVPAGTEGPGMAPSPPTSPAAAREQEIAAGESFQESTRRKLSRASKRRLTCQARVEVGVVVPPPFSLLPGLVLRQGASLILSTLVSTLTNRFLDLLVEDFYRWSRDDEASRAAASATGGGLLGWDPEQISDRRLTVEADDLEGEGDSPSLPPPEYMI